MVILLVVNVEVYLPIVSQDFTNWDDPQHIKQFGSPVRRRPPHLNRLGFDFYGSQVFQPPSFLELDLDKALILPFPVPQPWISKAFNVFFHVLKTMLVFSLLASMGMTSKSRFDSRPVFSIHPIQTASVAWISERKNLLMALFYLLRFTCFLKYLRSRARMALPLFLVFFLAGLLSKPQIVGLPLVAAAWALMMRDDRSLAPLNHPAAGDRQPLRPSRRTARSHDPRDAKSVKTTEFSVSWRSSP